MIDATLFCCAHEDGVTGEETVDNAIPRRPKL